MITDWTSFIPKMEQLLQRLTGKKHFPDNDERLEMLFQKMQSEHYLEQKIQAQQRFDYRQAEAAFLKLAKPRKQRLLIWRWAAILLLPLSMAAGFFFLHNNENRSNKAQTTQMALNDKHVYLLTSTQKTYDLTTGALPSGLDSHIKVGDKTLNYKETANNTDSLIEKKAEIHTLVIPRGGEYSITLPDKTHIWLNADSRISYPVYFSGNTREVTICGEAYFKVAKQEGKPFIVHTERGSCLGNRIQCQSLRKRRRFHNDVSNRQCFMHPTQRRGNITATSGSTCLQTGQNTGSTKNRSSSGLRMERRTVCIQKQTTGGNHPTDSPMV